MPSFQTLAVIEKVKAAKEELVSVLNRGAIPDPQELALLIAANEHMHRLQELIVVAQIKANVSSLIISQRHHMSLVRVSQIKSAYERGLL
jgi:hypothetical protein